MGFENILYEKTKNEKKIYFHPLIYYFLLGAFSINPLGSACLPLHISVLFLFLLTQRSRSIIGLP